MTFSFGQSQHERIDLDVLRYEREPVGEYHDDNWLTVKIQVCAGNPRARESHIRVPSSLDGSARP